MVITGILILLNINKFIYYSDCFVADAITFLSFPYTPYSKMAANKLFFCLHVC